MNFKCNFEITTMKYNCLPKSDQLTIPELGIAVVQVIDRVEIHVFCVPGKRRLPHAEIKVGCVDAIDFDLGKQWK